MMDMFFFMFLLSIWVIAYGVATQSIQIENENRFNWIIRGAVYEPYLIIFGTLPDNVDSTFLITFKLNFIRVVTKANWNC